VSDLAGAMEVSDRGDEMKLAHWDEQEKAAAAAREPDEPGLVVALGGFEDFGHEVAMEIDLADARDLDPTLAQVIDRLASLDHGRALESLRLAAQPEPREAAGQRMKSAFDSVVLPFNPTRRKVVKRNDLHRELGGGISQLNTGHPAWVQAQVNIARLLAASDPGAELRALVEGWLAAPGRSEQEVVFFWAAFSHWWDPIGQDLEARAQLPVEALRSALDQVRVETGVSRLAALIRACIAISRIRQAPRTAGLGTIGLLLSQDEEEQAAGVNALADVHGGRYPRLVTWTDAMASLDEVASKLVAALIAAGYLSAESAAVYLK
jgi:hypothetical protein